MATLKGCPAWWGQPERDVDEMAQVLFETVVAGTGVNITSVQLKRTAGGWKLIVKARSAQRGALICFYDARTWGECMAEFFYASGHKPGINWKKDRFAD